MKENLKNLIGTKVVIHCKEEGQAKRLVKRLQELGYGWHDTSNETYWQTYGKYTIYFLDDKCWLTYGYVAEKGLQQGEMIIGEERFRIVEFENLADFEGTIKPIKLKIVGIDEGKRFRFKGNNADYMLKDGIVMVETPDGGWAKSYVTANRLMDEITPINDIILTDNERKILEGRLAEGFNYMARDKDNDIYFYENKPVKNKSYFNWEADVEYKISFSLYDFKFLSWDDEEPTNIEELLNN